jgi:hypothetical protein
VLPFVLALIAAARVFFRSRADFLWSEIQSVSLGCADEQSRVTGNVRDAIAADPAAPGSAIRLRGNDRVRLKLQLMSVKIQAAC